MSSNEENNKQLTSESAPVEVPAVSSSTIGKVTSHYKCIGVLPRGDSNGDFQHKLRSSKRSTPSESEIDEPEAPLTELQQLQKYSAKKIKGIAKQKTPAQIAKDKLKKEKDNKKSSKAYDFILTYQKYPKDKLGAIRIRCGTAGQDNQFTVDAKILKEMQEYYKDLLLGRPEFNEELFYKLGGIMNPKFWEINISWGQSRLDGASTWFEAAEDLADYLQELL